MKRTVFTGRQTDEISFPLGGIGTGSIGLAGNGRLIDWEIKNIPDKGSVNGYTHFAVKAEKNGKLKDARVICGDVYKNLSGQTGKDFGYGLTNTSMEGFPHFRECVFTGEFPVADVSLDDPDSACSVKLTAFNPFIVQNEKDSSIPAAFFDITVTNKTSETLDFTMAGTLCNMYAGSTDKYFRSDGISGMLMTGKCEDRNSPDFGEMALCTDWNDVSYQEYWYRGDWFDNLEMYWRNFTRKPRFENRSYDAPGNGDHATIAAHFTLAAGESKTIKWNICWYNPVKPDQWYYEGEQPMVVRNYYSYVYGGARDVAEYCMKNRDRLTDGTMRWHDELFASTLPEEVIEAISANTSVLKTETSIRIGEKGDFYGWEGLGEKKGSCEGTCTHVWNYAYALPFLFPSLERGIRENDYAYNQRPDGGMVFRTRIPFGRGIGTFRPCVDGQLGGVIKVWREWKLSGDDKWLAGVWPGVKKSLEFVWSAENADRWDYDRDGVLEGRQHHTLDMELFGPSSWLEGFYLGALKAAADMARAMGENAAAEDYEALFAKGKKWCADNLFNGSYFIQKINLGDRGKLESFGDEAVERYWNAEVGQIKYQIGEGCALDQLLAQWHADIIGLGELFDAKQTDTALKNAYKNNFKENMRGHCNPFRLFAMNDESGAIVCDFPEGAERPAIPVPYAQETFHGFEYAFAGLLISRGYVEEGLRVVRGVRDRYRGDNRNPWNEIECGSNYARSMASFALIPVMSGMRFDMTAGMMGFNPVKTDAAKQFRSVWFLGDAWGNVSIEKQDTAIKVISGSMTLKTLRLPYMSSVSELVIDGKKTDFTFENGTLNFPSAKVEKEIMIK